MARRVCCSVVVLLVVGASALAAGGRSTRTGDYYRVICHFENDRVAAMALETAEAVWPLAIELFSLSEESPLVTGEIHLYRSIADYEKADQELTGGKFKRQRAFSNYQIKTAYIAIQPDCSDGALQTVGLSALTRQVIAAEAVNLFRYTSLKNFRAHPEWLSTGLSRWIWEQVATDRGWVSPAQSDPFMSTMMMRVIEMVEGKQLPPFKQILLDDLDDVFPGGRATLRWVAFRFLHDVMEAESFRSVMVRAKFLADVPEAAAQLEAFIQESLAPEVSKALDAKFAAYIRALKPEWDEAARSLATGGEHWVHSAFAEANAEAWRVEPVGTESYRLAGAFKILPGATQQLNLLLGRTTDGFICVGIDAGGRVVVFDYNPNKKMQWRRKYAIRLSELSSDQWTPFEVEVAGGQLQITVADTPAGVVSLDGRSMSGPWGLGALGGSIGMWYDVHLERRPATGGEK